MNLTARKPEKQTPQTNAYMKKFLRLSPRGKIGKVIKNYAKDLEEDLKNAIPDRVFITHSECDAKTVEEVRDYIASLGIFKEIIETRAGGVISSHCGPGTLGVLFIAK